jgi:ABC-type phosphate transport system substrate-binding protein
MARHYYIAGLLILLTCACGWSDDRPDAVAIIVAKKCTLGNVSQADLTRIFRGEKPRDPDGNKLVVLMRERGAPERAAILREIYRMSEQDYQTYFLQATFTGAVQSAPKKLNSASAVRQFVADNPGAIGYVRLKDVDDTVKIIKIDGKAPGDDGYKLGIP